MTYLFPNKIRDSVGLDRLNRRHISYETICLTLGEIAGLPSPGTYVAQHAHLLEAPLLRLARLGRYYVYIKSVPAALTCTTIGRLRAWGYPQVAQPLVETWIRMLSLVNVATYSRVVLGFARQGLADPAFWSRALAVLQLRVHELKGEDHLLMCLTAFASGMDAPKAYESLVPQMMKVPIQNLSRVPLLCARLIHGPNPNLECIEKLVALYVPTFEEPQFPHALADLSRMVRGMPRQTPSAPQFFKALLQWMAQNGPHPPLEAHWVLWESRHHPLEATPWEVPIIQGLGGDPAGFKGRDTVRWLEILLGVSQSLPEVDSYVGTCLRKLGSLPWAPPLFLRVAAILSRLDPKNPTYFQNGLQLIHKLGDFLIETWPEDPEAPSLARLQGFKDVARLWQVDFPGFATRFWAHLEEHHHESVYPLLQEVLAPSSREKMGHPKWADYDPLLDFLAEVQAGNPQLKTALISAQPLLVIGRPAHLVELSEFVGSLYRQSPQAFKLDFLDSLAEVVVDRKAEFSASQIARLLAVYAVCQCPIPVFLNELVRQFSAVPGVLSCLSLQVLEALAALRYPYARDAHELVTRLLGNPLEVSQWIRLLSSLGRLQMASASLSMEIMDKLEGQLPTLEAPLKLEALIAWLEALVVCEHVPTDRQLAFILQALKEKPLTTEHLRVLAQFFGLIFRAPNPYIRQMLGRQRVDVQLWASTVIDLYFSDNTAS